MLLRGASPPAAMRELGISPATLRRTLAECETFRQAHADVAEQLNLNVATAVYHTAMKGNVTAQALWLKNRPPPDWNVGQTFLSAELSPAARCSLATTCGRNASGRSSAA